MEYIKSPTISAEFYKVRFDKLFLLAVAVLNHSKKGELLNLFRRKMQNLPLLETGADYAL